MASPKTRRAEALVLAEQLLGEIELSAIGPVDIARKASRLARLIDDTDAMAWLGFEVKGYPKPLDETASTAAVRSARQVREPKQEGSGPFYWTQSLGELAASIEAGKAQITAAIDPPISLSSANPHQHVFPPKGNTNERGAVRNYVASQQAILDNVVGAMHSYIAERYQELRFGSAVESAFEVVRREVDASIAELVPDALPMLSAAFENAASNNPEDWANAAGTCRRLLKAAADKLRPSGLDVGGRPMGDGNYINRLVAWIVENSTSETAAKFITSDLSYLGERLDAADGAGQKGAHATVDRFDASRFITGTYLVLGDVLKLSQGMMLVEDVAAAERELPATTEGGSTAAVTDPS